MKKRPCPVCSTDASTAKLFLNENIDSSRVSKFSYASRKLPEFMCYRLVQCCTCDLVYADDPPSKEILANEYHEASFDSAQEAEDAAAAYVKAIGPLLGEYSVEGASALEIGTGTGIFLEALKELGFDRVVGVEPSAAAVSAAPTHRKNWIRQCVFNESDFEPNSFDLICCFMTLEHVADPNEILESATRLLKDGGAVALVTHDYRSPLNRLLGKRSPIIDIEHLQLFSKKSVQTLMARNGFDPIVIQSFRNCYSVRYWLRLLPLPVKLKLKTIKLLDLLGITDKKLSFNVGNILTFGRLTKK